MLVIANAPVTTNSEIFEKTSIITQDQGTRLDPEDHTDHVPILIDEASDWTDQGWPGSGTQGNPYLIEALNITYDVDTTGIRIINTDAYFIIRDCYINQLSNTDAIEIVNTTHATIEYLTIFSEDNGVVLNNADNTDISDCDIESEEISLQLITSTGIDIENNRLHTLDNKTFTGVNCTNLSMSHNDISCALALNVVDFDNCNVSSFNGDRIIDGMRGIAMANCHTVNLQGVIVRSSFINGIEFSSSSDVNCSDCDIISDGTYGMEFDNTPNVIITGSIVESQTGDSINLDTCNDSLVSDNHIPFAGGYGIYIVDGDRTNVTGNIIDESDSYGIRIGNSIDILVLNNEIADSTNYGIYVFSTENILLSGNHISEASADGIRVWNSPGVEISHNTILDSVDDGISLGATHNAAMINNTIISGDTGIEFSTVENWTVSGNIISDTDSHGIYITQGDNHTVTGNTISNIDGYGIYSTLHSNGYFAHNNITETTSYSFYLDNGDNSTIYNNMFIDSYTLLAVDTTVNTVVDSNALIDGSYSAVEIYSSDYLDFIDNIIDSYCEYGVYFDRIQNSTITGNNLTDCGFIYELYTNGQYYDNTVSNNYVNGLPYYYAFEQNNLNIDGSDYGQIFLVNCTNSDITGGVLSRNTLPVGIAMGSNILISGMEYSDITVGILAYNITGLMISDIEVYGPILYQAITLISIIDFHLDNITAIGDASSGLGMYAVTSFNGSIHEFDASYFTSGAYLMQMENVTVSESAFMNNEDRALYIYNSDNITIQDGLIQNATYGIYLQSSSEIDIVNNEIRYCSTYGIYGYTSSDDYINVTLSLIEENNYGIRVSGGDYWTITNNTIRWNHQYGVYLTSSIGDEIHYNEFYLNAAGNGYDNSAKFWDDNIDTGNWWYPYDGNPPYEVNGGVSDDRYPMLFMVTEPIINSPMDIYYAEGSTGNTITWYPLDNSLRDWEVTIDGVVTLSGVWNFDSIEVNIDGLAYGDHTVVVTVWDVDQHSVNDTVLIHVYDDTPPEIEDLPNQYAFVDGSGQTLEWEVSDLHPGEYILIRDGEEYETGTWNAGILSVNIDGMAEGEYLFIMEIRDLDGNADTDSVRVRVINDDVSPTIDSPADISYIYGTEGHYVVWTPEDEYPDSYEIEWNGTIIKSGAWGGGKIILNVDDLSPGTYEFILTVYDGSGRTASDGVNVTVSALGEIAPPVDWGLLLIIGAGIGGVIIIISAVLYYQKRKSN